MSICILGFVFSFRTTFVGVLLAPTVFQEMSALPTVPTFHRILALVPSLHLPLPLPCLPLLRLPLPLPKATMSIGSSPLGGDDPFLHAFAWPLHSQYVLIFSLKTPHEVNLERFQLHVFLEIIWQRSFQGTHANVFR